MTQVMHEREKHIMPTAPRKSNLKAVPTAAPEAPAATPAAPPAKTKVDFAALASKGQKVEALPKMGRDAQENPFIEQVRESFADGKAVALPPIPVEALTPVKVAIRRAATLADLGVSIRETTTDDGVVVTFLGKTRQNRAAK